MKVTAHIKTAQGLIEQDVYTDADKQTFVNNLSRTAMGYQVFFGQPSGVDLALRVDDVAMWTFPE